MAKKRITELATETTLKDGQYVAIDHTTDGTKKLNLGAELTDLKEELNESKNGKMFINGSFSYGIFNSSNFPESDPRKFNAVMMMAEKYDRDITITAKTGYNFLAYRYNDSDAYVGKSSSWGTSTTIPANTSFRLWVRPTPLDTSVILDLVTVKESIVFNSEINDRVEKNANDIANEKANIYAIADGHVFFDTEFIYGKMNTTTGAVVPDTTKYQVVMPDFITADKDLTLDCNSGYRYQVWWYTDQDVYISRTGSFKTAGEKYTVPAGTNFRLFVTLDPPNSQATVPIDTFAKNVFMATEVQNQVTNIRTKPLTVLPDYILNSLSYKAIGQLSKGYILLSCDDGTEGLATYTIPMLINKNVPATFGLLMISPVITNANYLETVIDAVENHGCCVAQHGSAQWTTYAEDTLNKYFDDTEALFTENGITEIHGAICPGGAAADTNTLVKAIAGGRFGSVFSGGLQDEVKYGNYNAVGARTNIYAMARYSAIAFTQQTYQQAIDDAYDNHYILCPFWHDYSVVNDTAKQAVIEGMIDYAKAKGLTFITMADLPYIT